MAGENMGSIQFKEFCDYFMCS